MSYTATGLGAVGMPRGFRGFACAVVATTAIFLPSGASSAQTTEVLGGDATLYRILVADADGSPVDGTRGETLVLEVARAGETPARFMVPGTEDTNAEVAPSLSFSESTRTLYVAWEHRVNSLHSRIQAMGFQPESGFSPIVDMIGNPFYAKRSPRVALTSEVAAWREEQAAEGEASDAAETVFDQKVAHVVWREEQGHVFYSAVGFSASGASRTLDALNLSSHFPGLDPEYYNGVDGTLELRLTEEGRAARISFIDPVNQRLEIVDVSTLPIPISTMADYGFARIIDASADSEPTLVEIAEDARSHIVHIGRNMRVSGPASDLLAREVERTVLSAGSQFEEGNLVGVAEEARSHIVHIGRSLNVRGLSESPTALAIRLEMTETQASTAEARPEPSVNLFLTHVASLELPTDVPAHADMAVSNDAAHVLLYWNAVDEDALYFVERDGDSWSDTLKLTTEQVGSLERGRLLLKNRFRSKD